MATVVNSGGVSAGNGSFATIYTVADSSYLEVAIVRISNTNGTEVTVRACLVNPGGSAQTSNAIVWDMPIPANDFVEFASGDLWVAGQTLQVRGSTSGVTCFVSGATERRV
jgi:hypothetical protein